ncbi:4Fe-4S dicluster domain-containing protein [Paradesulfitobacterium aromaticivorans]
MLTIRVDEGKCNGCGQCQVVCALGRARDQGQPGWPVQSNARLDHRRQVRDLPLPLLNISGAKEQRIINICRHCEKPLCVDACVAKALMIDEKQNIVRLEREKCVGCRSCVMECPFGAVRFPHAAAEEETIPSLGTTLRPNRYSSLEQDGRALKCEGCLEWDEPLCAAFCPTGALQASRMSHGMATTTRRRRAALISLQRVGANSGHCQQKGGFDG